MQDPTEEDQAQREGMWEKPTKGTQATRREEQGRLPTLEDVTFSTWVSKSSLMPEALPCSPARQAGAGSSLLPSACSQRCFPYLGEMLNLSNGKNKAHYIVDL